MLRDKLGRFKKGFIPWNKGQGEFKRCLNCNNKFYINKYKLKQGKGKFCSIKCRKDYQIKLSKNYKLTSDMAELIGVIIGDGCINKYSNSNNYRIFISGNPIEDKEYMERYLPELIKKCINIDKKPFVASNGAYLIQFTSESFRLFLKSLNILPNKTKSVNIPEKIKKNKKLLVKCIRGIADTDFTLIFKKNKPYMKHNHPRISAQFASSNLVKDLEESFKKLGFTFNVKYKYKIIDKRGYSWYTNKIDLEGHKNLKRWLKMIGFSNSRIISKYKVWKKYGSVKPRTTMPERIKLLNVGAKEVVNFG